MSWNWSSSSNGWNVEDKLYDDVRHERLDRVLFFCMGGMV